MAMEGGAKSGCVAATSDNLSGKYNAAAKDRTKAAKSREACMLFSIAEGHLTEEEDQQALQVAEEALELFRETGDEVGIADSSRVVTHVLCFQDRRKEANTIARAELDRIQAGKDRRGEAKLMLALAEINSEKRGQKNREEALAYAIKAQEKFKEQGDKRMEAMSYLALANFYLKRRGDQRKGAEEALTVAGKAEAIFKELDDKRGQATALHSAAASHIKAKMANDEIEAGAWLVAAQEAARLYQEQRLRKLEAWEKCCIAQWTLIENPRKALRLAHEALNLSREIGSVQEATALGLVVSCHLEIKDTSEAWMTKEAGEAVKVAKDGLKRFRAKNDKFGEGQALLALLLAYLGREDTDQALKTAEQARGVFEDLGDSSSEALVLQMLTQLYLKRSHTDKALNATQKVAKLSRATQDRLLALEGTYEVHMQNGEHGKAVETAQHMQAIAEDEDETKKAAVARLLRSNAHLQQEDFVEAVVVAREAQAIFHDMDAVKEEAEALRIIAEIQTAGRDYEAGLRAAERSKRLLLEAGDVEGEAGAAYLTAQIRLLMLVQGRGEIPDAKVDLDFAQECGEALEFAEDAVAVAKKAGSKKLAASVFCTVAQIHTAAMDSDKAFAAVDEAMTIFKELGDEVNMASVMCIESDVHLVSGNTNKATSVINKALNIFRDQGDVRGEWVALGILDYISGPQEEEQWTDAELQQWQLEQWQAQQAATGGQQQEQQQQDQGPGEQMVAKKKREPRVDTGERLNPSNLSMESVQSRLLEIVRFSVEVDDDEAVNIDTPLMQMGITSKSAVTLRNALSEELPSLNMPFTLVFDYPSVSSMAELIIDQVPTGGGRRR
uniref:Carrier domain-containing protein n=1 Tax=Alexandrium monilatum TaxID=311494 RepID=A0A7S4VT89_9DINO